MTKTQLAIRLEAELIEGLDWLVLRCDYATRSDAIREAIRRVLDGERRRQIDEQYADAYSRQPQTDDELAFLSGQSFQHLDDPGDFDDWVVDAAG